MPDGEARGGDGGVPYTTIAALLRLSKLRSEFLVGRALAERYPTEEEWEEALDDRELIEQLDSLGLVADDMRSHLGLEEPTPESVQNAVGQHYQQAIESIQLFAEEIGTDVQDLLNVLVND